MYEGGVPGGTRVVVPEFGLTTALVFTSDTSLIVRFQELRHFVVPGTKRRMLATSLPMRLVRRRGEQK